MPSAEYRWLATTTALAAWALIVVGGVVRVTESGLGCPHWPLCTSRALPLDRAASVIEYTHRVLVAVVSVLAVATLHTADEMAAAISLYDSSGFERDPAGDFEPASGVGLRCYRLALSTRPTGS